MEKSFLRLIIQLLSIKILIDTYEKDLASLKISLLKKN